jgi:cytochrome b6-f complex iron-sulfur subunit
MGNWKLAPWQEPKTLTREVLREMRHGRPAGLSRRTLIRRSLGAGIGLWLLEVAGGTLGFLWPNMGVGFGGVITLGDQETIEGNAEIEGAGLADGAPSYFSIARAYIQLVDTSRGFQDGDSQDGEGETTNVMAIYQRCPHLGCKPNFCPTNYWFECACHGSRYDRLGVKVLELGPAPRGMDRFAHTVEGGVLTVDTSRINLGPLPVALGQPGIIPARSPQGCV